MQTFFQGKKDIRYGKMPSVLHRAHATRNAANAQAQGGAGRLGGIIPKAFLVSDFLI
jgi:hypothetical protein